MLLSHLSFDVSEALGYSIVQRSAICAMYVTVDREFLSMRTVIETLLYIVMEICNI